MYFNMAHPGAQPNELWSECCAMDDIHTRTDDPNDLEEPAAYAAAGSLFISSISLYLSRKI